MTGGIRLPSSSITTNKIAIGQNHSDADEYITHLGFPDDYGYEDLKLDPFYNLNSVPSRTNKQWYIGDFVRNADPAQGEPVGWLCVTTSTPGVDAGTWKKLLVVREEFTSTTKPVTTGAKGDIAWNSGVIQGNVMGWVNTDGATEWEAFGNVAQTQSGFSWETTKIWRGSAAPVSGTWTIGDIVLDSAPSASGKIGWVCTVSGTPGTWKTWGAIDA
jgi:hypothetical protein